MKLKSVVKNKLLYYPKINSEIIKKNIGNYKYVSFDIFDTLIKRDVENNRDIFKILELDYYGNLDNNFYRNRIKAEIEARNKAKEKEVTIHEIYKNLSKTNQYSDVELEILKNKEILFEQKYCTKNIDIFEIYKYCIESNKKVIIVSNMYLDEKIIKSILNKNGYTDYYKLYVSSSTRKRKDGDLFKYVLEDLNIDSNQIIHIGDSLRDDIKGSKKYGIKSIRLPNKTKKIKHYNKDLFADCNYNILENFINNRLVVNNDEYYNFGYECFGKLLYGFNIWLKNELDKKNVKKVYFLSRDGYILKDGFDIYNTYGIDSNYLEMSRRSTRVPMLWLDLSLKEIYKSFPAATLTNINVFFDTIGLEIDKYSDILNRLNIEKNYTFKKKDMLENEKIISLYNTIESDIYENSKKEYNLLVEYLKQNIKDSKVAIVDIGWRGSMQKFIATILKNENIDVDIIGFYMGLTSGAKEYKSEIIEYGYLFDCFNNENDIDTRGAYVGLFESLFLHNIGSVKKYKYKDNRVVPEYYCNEYYDKNGNLNISIKNIINIQRGAVDFIKAYKSSQYNCIENMNKEELYNDIKQIGTAPKIKDIKMFSNIDFFDGEVSKLADPKNIFYYMVHPQIIIKDFYNSRWKVGFLKKLFKVKMPYYKIYKILKKEK